MRRATTSRKATTWWESYSLTETYYLKESYSLKETESGCTSHGPENSDSRKESSSLPQSAGHKERYDSKGGRPQGEP